MDCVTAKEYLSVYSDGELHAELASQMCDHIAGCSNCRDEIASFNKLSTLFADSTVPSPPAGLWANIETGMETSTEVRSVAANRRTGFSSRVLRLALAASLLLAVGIWRSNDHHQHDELAVNLQDVMSQFAKEPLLAVNKLSEQYQGVEVSLDAAEDLLGYRPAIGNSLPTGYQLTSTRVLKMPCCTCSASICRRTDGTSFVVFEHNTEQQMWFGDAPAVSAKCGGKECRLMEMPEQMPEQMAVTWKNGNRQLTAIGVNGVEEVASLVAAVDGHASAG
jgi:hypothetical protein